MRISAKISVLLLILAAALLQSTAIAARFFRIAGPVPTKITAFTPDGTLIWSTSDPNTNYIVQTAPNLEGGTNWVDYLEFFPTNSLNTNRILDFNPPSGMAFIPAGIFTMGDTLDGETDASPTNVYVSSFFMDVNLVSYSQWGSVYDWATNHGYAFDNPGSGKATNQPVQTVDWFDAVKWCNARSAQAGLTPVYYTDAAFADVYTNGQTAPYVNWSANGYRLPTEAEWEKAARGGLIKKRFPWGDTISEAQANYVADTTNYTFDLGPDGPNAYATGLTPYTSPVGAYSSNGYGLYDMAGNVLEWCWDWYGTLLPGGRDPHGPPTGSNRVLRGGDWNHKAIYASCATRINISPTAFVSSVGFRCARTY